MDIRPHPADLRRFLANHGFSLTDDLTTSEAGDRYCPPRTRAERGSRLYHIAAATPTPQ